MPILHPKSRLPSPEAAPLPLHYYVVRKLGLPPLLCCPCGASIAVPSSPRARPSRELRAFLAVHDACRLPPQDADGDAAHPSPAKEQSA